MDANPLERAAQIAKEITPYAKNGWGALGVACGVSYVTVRDWSHNGRLPLVCLLGFRDYHNQIADAVDNQVTADELLLWTLRSWEKYYKVQDETPVEKLLAWHEKTPSEEGVMS